MMILFLLLSNVAAFGQESTENNEIATNTNIEMNSIKQETNSDSSNMNFILWFMGSKQSPNANVIPDGTTAKKQYINSGTEPNRLLIKAFLKKAVNFESSLS